MSSSSTSQTHNTPASSSTESSSTVDKALYLDVIQRTNSTEALYLIIRTTYAANLEAIQKVLNEEYPRNKILRGGVIGPASQEIWCSPPNDTELSAEARKAAWDEVYQAVMYSVLPSFGYVKATREPFQIGNASSEGNSIYRVKYVLQASADPFDEFLQEGETEVDQILAHTVNFKECWTLPKELPDFFIIELQDTLDYKIFLRIIQDIDWTPLTGGGRNGIVPPKCKGDEKYNCVYFFFEDPYTARQVMPWTNLRETIRNEVFRDTFGYVGTNCQPTLIQDRTEGTLQILHWIRFAREPTPTVNIKPALAVEKYMDGRGKIQYVTFHCGDKEVIDRIRKSVLDALPAAFLKLRRYSRNQLYIQPTEKFRRSPAKFVGWEEIFKDLWLIIEGFDYEVLKTWNVPDSLRGDGHEIERTVFRDPRSKTLGPAPTIDTGVDELPNREEPVYLTIDRHFDPFKRLVAICFYLDESWQLTTLQTMWERNKGIPEAWIGRREPKNTSLGKYQLFVIRDGYIADAWDKVVRITKDHSLLEKLGYGGIEGGDTKLVIEVGEGTVPGEMSATLMGHPISTPSTTTTTTEEERDDDKHTFHAVDTEAVERARFPYVREPEWEINLHTPEEVNESFGEPVPQDYPAARDAFYADANNTAESVKVYVSSYDVSRGDDDAEEIRISSKNELSLLAACAGIRELLTEGDGEVNVEIERLAGDEGLCYWRVRTDRAGGTVGVCDSVLKWMGFCEDEGVGFGGAGGGDGGVFMRDLRFLGSRTYVRMPGGEGEG